MTTGRVYVQRSIGIQSKSPLGQKQCVQRVNTRKKLSVIIPRSSPLAEKNGDFIHGSGARVKIGRRGRQMLKASGKTEMDLKDVK
jgi:hypothetical protein